VVLAGLAEAVAIGWFLGPEKLRQHFNAISDFRIGPWWDFLIKYWAPLIMIVMGLVNFVAEIQKLMKESFLGAILVGLASSSFGTCSCFLIDQNETERICYNF